MKSEVAVSKHCNILSPVEKCITHSTVADTSSLKFLNPRNCRSLSFASCSKDHADGVSYCAVCDAFFYRGQDVAVLGNSDFALHEAEELAPMAGSVTIYTDGKEPEFSRKSSFEVNTMKIQSVEGDEKVSGLRLVSESETDAKSDTDEEKNLQLLPEGKKAEMEASEFHSQESPVRDSTETFVPADGVFVALGTAGSAEMARQMGAALTEKGNIKVNEKMESTIPGLFAAGDCTGGLLQVAKAVYDGAQAGLSANQYVRNRQKK